MRVFVARTTITKWQFFCVFMDFVSYFAIPTGTRESRESRIWRHSLIVGLLYFNIIQTPPRWGRGVK